jgi:Zn-dependent M28 family amino/carboxypeptidase
VQTAILIAACAHGSRPAPLAEHPDTRPDVVRLRHDIEYLASPALDGRRAGTPGSDSAANFITRTLAELGLYPAFAVSDCGRAPCRRSYLQLFRTNTIATANVGAIIAGSDSLLRDEVVAITAHYDHLGRSAGDARDPAPTAMHPGADDNASGTAAILELARRLADRPPRRSVLVLAFSAEELGLLGSRAFVEHPPLDLRRIVIALNLDMVGRLRNDRVTVYGVGSSYLRALVDTANVVRPLALQLEPKSSGRSDDFSFSAHGVPALHFTTGEHLSYHRTTDTANQIDFDGLARVTDFVERVARAATDSPRPP